MQATQAKVERKAARGSLLGIEGMSAADINALLQSARKMNPAKPSAVLRGKRVLLLFYEPSTRTRTSFEVAAQALGATTTLVLSSGSSIEKGESLLDTGPSCPCPRKGSASTSRTPAGRWFRRLAGRR